MLRVLVVSCAMLAVSQLPCAAAPALLASDTRETTSPSSVSHSNAAAASASFEDHAAENELLEMANKSRGLAGVPPLRMEDNLREAARAHARLMVASELLEHRFPGEPALLERIARVTFM